MARRSRTGSVTSFEDRCEERDGHLVRRIRQNADDMRMYLREWIQQELKDARIQLQLLETVNAGPVADAIRERIERVNDVDYRELREIDERLEDRLRDVDATSYPDPTEARVYLEEGVNSFERLVRELLQIRAFIAASELTAEDES